MSDENIKAAA